MLLPVNLINLVSAELIVKVDKGFDLEGNFFMCYAGVSHVLLGKGATDIVSKVWTKFDSLLRGLGFGLCWHRVKRTARCIDRREGRRHDEQNLPGVLIRKR